MADKDLGLGGDVTGQASNVGAEAMGAEKMFALQSVLGDIKNAIETVLTNPLYAGAAVGKLSSYHVEQSAANISRLANLSKDSQVQFDRLAESIAKTERVYGRLGGALIGVSGRLGQISMEIDKNISKVTQFATAGNQNGGNLGGTVGALRTESYQYMQQMASVATKYGTQFRENYEQQYREMRNFMDMQKDMRNMTPAQRNNVIETMTGVGEMRGVDYGALVKEMVQQYGGRGVTVGSAFGTLTKMTDLWSGMGLAPGDAGPAIQQALGLTKVLTNSGVSLGDATNTSLSGIANLNRAGFGQEEISGISELYAKSIADPMSFLQPFKLNHTLQGSDREQIQQITHMSVADFTEAMRSSILASTHGKANSRDWTQDERTVVEQNFKSLMGEETFNAIRMHTGDINDISLSIGDSTKSSADILKDMSKGFEGYNKSLSDAQAKTQPVLDHISNMWNELSLKAASSLGLAPESAFHLVNAAVVGFLGFRAMGSGALVKNALGTAIAYKGIEGMLDVGNGGAPSKLGAIGSMGAMYLASQKNGVGGVASSLFSPDNVPTTDFTTSMVSPGKGPFKNWSSKQMGVGYGMLNVAGKVAAITGMLHYANETAFDFDRMNSQFGAEHSQSSKAAAIADVFSTIGSAVSMFGGPVAELGFQAANAGVRKAAALLTHPFGGRSVEEVEHAEFLVKLRGAGVSGVAATTSAITDFNLQTMQRYSKSHKGITDAQGNLLMDKSGQFTVMGYSTSGMDALPKDLKRHLINNDMRSDIIKNGLTDLNQTSGPEGAKNKMDITINFMNGDGTIANQQIFSDVVNHQNLSISSALLPGVH